MKKITDKTLVARAREAAGDSYSPYSRFPVGAALLAGGTVFTGCNVENASYGLTLCAERVAVTTAIAAGQREFTALAVAGGKGSAARPCGACLQVLAEFCAPDFPILLAPLDKTGALERHTLADLLPRAFRMKASSPNRPPTRRRGHPRKP